MSKTPKLKSHCFKPSVNEKAEVISFIDEQSNLNDTIRYLMEKEIAENGIRDLANYIPAKRTIESLRTIINPETFAASANTIQTKTIKDTPQNEVKQDLITSKSNKEFKKNVNIKKSALNVNKILEKNSCYDD